MKVSWNSNQVSQDDIVVEFMYFRNGNSTGKTSAPLLRMGRNKGEYLPHSLQGSFFLENLRKPQGKRIRFWKERWCGQNGQGTKP